MSCCTKTLSAIIYKFLADVAVSLQPENSFYLGGWSSWIWRINKFKWSRFITELLYFFPRADSFNNSNTYIQMVRVRTDVWLYNVILTIQWANVYDTFARAANILIVFTVSSLVSTLPLANITMASPSTVLSSMPSSIITVSDLALPREIDYGFVNTLQQPNMASPNVASSNMAILRMTCPGCCIGHFFIQLGFIRHGLLQ